MWKCMFKKGQNDVTGHKALRMKSVSYSSNALKEIETKTQT